MSENVQRIKVTQKFNTQPIYVNPEPDTIKIVGEGGGDMSKSVYDTNDNGIVDNAEALMGHSYDEIKKMIDDAYYQRYATVNYRDTTIHANNSLKRNLVDENTKIEVLGQTIQNLVDDSNIWKVENTYQTDSETNTSLSTLLFNNLQYCNLKPNTTYTIFFDYIFTENTLTDYYIQCNCFNGGTSSFLVSFSKTEIDAKLKIKTFTTKDNYEKLYSIFLGGSKGSTKFKNNGFMILEGDWTNKEVSFVPFGLNYPLTTEVVENGTQLLSKDDLETDISNPLNGIKYTMNADGSITAKGTTSASSHSIVYYKNIIDRLEDGKTYSYDSDTVNGVLRITFNDDTPDDFKRNVTVDKKRMKLIKPYIRFTSAEGEIDKTLYPMLNEGSTSKPWEPYTERRITIDKPLASVSDTIRDRYYVKDGKKYHEQNIKEFIFNGGSDEQWERSMYTTDLILVAAIVNFRKRGVIEGEMLSKNYYNSDNIKIGACRIYNDRDSIRFCVDKTKYPTIESFKASLATTPIECLVPINPITTEIETEDMQSFDGQTNITTTNTVKPTLDIDIPSDLNAVTSNLIAENMALKQENQALSNELENQASSIEAQQANMDYISMMTGVDL